MITVKVPVKKAGKAKIYGNDFRQINEEKHCEIESYEVKPTGGCKCCECLRKSRKEELTEGYETHWKEEECRKIKAKKQEPFKKNSKSFRRLAESDSSEGIDICSEEVGYKDPCNTLRQSGSSKNGYPESSADYKMSQAYFKLNGLVNTRSRSSSKEERKISSRETPSDYNNYVDYRSADTYHSKDRYQLPCRDEERRKLSPCGRCCKPRLQLDERKESKSSPTRKCLQGGDPYISDYYNYDKREYMTKSELLKEERRKKKVHQPSLQVLP